MWNHTIYQHGTQILPAILNFKYQHASHVNMFFPRKSQLIKYDHGTPMSHVIPMSESHLDVKCHLVTEQEIKTLTSRADKFVFFNKRYPKLKKSIDTIEKKKKCPFGFGS